MFGKTFAKLALLLLITSVLVSYSLDPAKANTTSEPNWLVNIPDMADGTIYIRSDGSIEPSTANIATDDGVTYYFTGDNNDGIIVEKSNIVIDGRGFTLRMGAMRAIGIYTEHYSDITVKNLRITSFLIGIAFIDSSNSAVFDCEITSFYLIGIAMLQSTGIILHDNIVLNGWMGIGLHQISNGQIYKNHVKASSYGIVLENDSQTNEVYENRVEGGHYGVFLWESADNKFYHNDFLDQVVHVHYKPTSYPPANTWDDGYPSGGNYWSAYTGVDTDSDGIGDTPYIMNSNNQDNYPLMSPYTAAPITYTVTVTIVEVRAIDTLDPAGSGSLADFYARVTIDGVDLPPSQARSDDDDIYPEWTFSRSVDQTPVPIHIELWDSDANGDDHVDIDKDANDQDLDISFDRLTQSITGDVTYGFSQGGGGDGNRAQIWFNVGLYTGDRDGDGLFDSWETHGIHMDDDGVVDLNLPTMGANPDHKDLFIEIDWMADNTHSHRPRTGVSQAVIAAFANAPVNNPDLVTGINLHVDESNSVPHQDTLAVWSGFDAIKNTNFVQDRRFVYHYCLFIHDIQGLVGTSGIAELPGNDFIVSLGSWAGGVGTFQQQAGTLMHEFGHNLNLGHGGGDHENYKPNYLSIMSYHFQMEGILPTGRLDYSQEALPNLNENNLNENLGIQDGTDNTRYYSPTRVVLTGQGTGAIDWNDDGATAANIQADINGDGTHSVLTGYNDWENLLYNARGRSDFEDGVHLTSESLVELDIATYRSFKRKSIQKFAEGPHAVDLHTECYWNFTYMMTNSHDYDVYDISIKDNFGANLAVEFLSTTKGEYIQFTNGPKTQQRFTWTIPHLDPWETIVLKVQVSTGKNRAQKQEFTSPGLHILNSGATSKWVNASGIQDSDRAGQISVWAGVAISDDAGAIAGYIRTLDSDIPQSGFLVELYNTLGTIIASTVTDQKGFYSFSLLMPAEYLIICEGGSFTAIVNAAQVTGVDFTLVLP